MKIRLLKRASIVLIWSVTLLYLTKNSKPDITNAVRELPKSMDGASKLSIAKLVLDTKALGLHIVPTMSDGIWPLETFSDSDFANEKETRISVWIHCILLWSTYCMEE